MNSPLYKHPTTPEKDQVEVPCIVRAETEKAIAIIPAYLDSFENLEETVVWIPLSQVDEIHPDRVVVRHWIAEKKGLL